MVNTSFFVVPSLLEKCVLFSIISFHHLRSVSQSVSHLQLPLFSLTPLHCAFVSHVFPNSVLVSLSSVSLLQHHGIPLRTDVPLSLPLPSALSLRPCTN